MKYRVFFCIVSMLLSLSILLSCNKRPQQDINSRVEALIGKEIITPFVTQDSSKSWRIITFIDGNCGKCINDLSKWKQWVIKYKNNVEFLFYFKAEDKSIMSFIDSVYVNLDYPLILDVNTEYLKSNNLNRYNSMFQTFLLDESNKVVVVGNPLYGKEISNLYYKNIDKQSVD